MSDDTHLAEFRIVKRAGRWQWELDDGGLIIAGSPRSWRTWLGAYLAARRCRRMVARAEVPTS